MHKDWENGCRGQAACLNPDSAFVGLEASFHKLFAFNFLIFKMQTSSAYLQGLPEGLNVKKDFTSFVKCWLCKAEGAEHTRTGGTGCNTY
jgi:hypothetical protein